MPPANQATNHGLFHQPVRGLLFLFCCLIASCGGKEDSASLVTTIKSASQGSEAASSGIQTSQAAIGLSDIASSFSNLGGSIFGLSSAATPMTLAPPTYAKIIDLQTRATPPLQQVSAKMKMAHAKGLFAPIDEKKRPCPDGGTFSFSGTSESTGGKAILTFEACRQEATETTGKIDMTATRRSLEVTLDMSVGTSVSPFVIIDYVAPKQGGKPYQTKAGTLKAILTLTATLPIPQPDLLPIAPALSSFFDISGTGSFENTASSPTTTTFTFDRFKNETSLSLPVATEQTYTHRLNGKITESKTTAGLISSAEASFESFTLTETATPTSVNLSLEGTLVTSFNPTSTCQGSGRYTYKTITPIRLLYRAALTDFDSDGIPDEVDPDDDGDGILDVDEDANQNGIADSKEDTDQDKIMNDKDPDDDGNGIADRDEDPPGQTPDLYFKNECPIAGQLTVNTETTVKFNSDGQGNVEIAVTGGDKITLPCTAFFKSGCGVGEPFVNLDN